MLPVLDNEAMREADRHTIEDLGVPSLDLMENAATGLVDAIRDSFPEARQILILSGRGNNGGDGLAAARLLAGGGLEVKVLLVAKLDAPDFASRQAADRELRSLGVAVLPHLASLDRTQLAREQRRRLQRIRQRRSRRHCAEPSFGTRTPRRAGCCGCGVHG